LKSDREIWIPNLRKDSSEKKAEPILTLPLLTVLVGGLPHPPPEGAWKGDIVKGGERSQPPDLGNCILYAKN